MKSILLTTVFSLFSFIVIAQTQTAYCDVYARGGGRNMRITIMYDNNKQYIGRANLGLVLNKFSRKGWILDQNIVIPRHPFGSFPATRHKLHLIMKKEYQQNLEDPFTSLLQDITNSNTDKTQENNHITSNIPPKQEAKVTSQQNRTYKIGDVYNLNGYDCIVSEVSEDGKHGKVIYRDKKFYDTWDNAHKNCKKLGENWRLITESEMDNVIKNINIINEAISQNTSYGRIKSAEYWVATPLSSQFAKVLYYWEGKEIEWHKCDRNVSRRYIAICEF